MPMGKLRTDRPQIGDTFGLLTIVGPEHRDHRGDRVYLCRCRCGNEKRVRTGNLLHGNSTTCGCRGKALGGRRYGGVVEKDRLISVADWDKACTVPTLDDLWRGALELRASVDARRDELNRRDAVKPTLWQRLFGWLGVAG